MSSYGLGWNRPRADLRDLTLDHPALAESVPGWKTALAPLPPSVDLRGTCPPIVDQGALGSCTANAAAGLLGCFEKRAFGKSTPASRLFLYKATRKLMGVTGDTGANLRDAMKALTLLGAPAEAAMPYDIPHFDAEPSAYQYALAADYKAVKYVRLDRPTATPAGNLAALKSALAAKAPAMFGFTCYASLQSPRTATDGKIPFPAAGEATVGGHAIVAVGYDDTIQCPNATPGAMLIRNSWGTSWGMAGYGYLPYDYWLQGQADDMWTLTAATWVDTGVFA